jgi:hypothetical protein
MADGNHFRTAPGATYPQPIQFDETAKAPRDFIAAATASAERAGLTPWTTYDQLTPDQRERFGDYVKAKDEVRAQAAWNAARRRETERALDATGGDKLAALRLMLGGRV